MYGPYVHSLSFPSFMARKHARNDSLKVSPSHPSTALPQTLKATIISLHEIALDLAIPSGHST
jgi:hypothetical protein